MNVFVEKQKKELELEFTGTVASLLQKLDIASNTVIVVRKGEVLLGEDVLKNSDSVKVLSVISGG